MRETVAPLSQTSRAGCASPKSKTISDAGIKRAVEMADGTVVILAYSFKAARRRALRCCTEMTAEAVTS